MLGLGTDVVTARKYAYLSLGQFTVNTADVVSDARFGVPVGGPSVRILGIHLLGSAVPSDPDGVMQVDAIVNDVSEGADDTLVLNFDAETVITAANQYFEATFETEGTEEERTLDPGDSLRFTLSNDSAAITTNPLMYALIEYMNVPRLQSAEDLPSYVGYPSQMAQF